MEKISWKVIVSIATIVITIVGGFLGFIGTMILNSMDSNETNIKQLMLDVAYLRALEDAKKRDVDVYDYADILAEIGLDSLTTEQRLRLRAILLHEEE